MARLSAADRAKLPDSAFAYIDSRGERRLPINDESHVRNALARFDQVKYDTPAAREKARDRLLKAAKKHGIMPIGFITNQLRTNGDRSRPAQDLPDGVVTLVFTDIEGSTLLLRELGADYESVLDQVRRIILRCVQEAGGTEVEIRADETFSVFENAAKAVDAAVAIQNTIIAVDWLDGHDVRVRAGIHTGKVTLTSNGYIGLAVNKAARVCSAAHGGQIVTSNETRRAAGSEVAADIGFRTVGRHQLAGLSETHELFQLEADGLISSFPELRT